MTEYYIRIEEEFYSSETTRDPVSRTLWEVTTDECTVDNGMVGYGGPVGEAEARKHAERAATLHAKQEAARARIIKYDFTPEI
ncbi:MAG: hypothetical protein LC723_14915 [Actinobacteria bacterium]|nr:hypothetical protein [Actinomycetota bacterium]